MRKVFISITIMITVLLTGCVEATDTATYTPEFLEIDDNQSYEVGDVFEPLLGVIAHDPKDGVITDNVEVKGLGQLELSELNEFTKAGNFTLTYLITNSTGVTTQKAVNVNVKQVYVEGGLNYELVWFDEFDYVGLPDSDKWYFEEGGHGWGNGESQYYTVDDTDNAYVSDGALTITAIKESYSNSNYTSVRLNSKGGGSYLYGYIEIKAKLPSGRGTWPAIWMLPTNWEYGGWPKSGEIDIMEHVGYDPNKVHYTIHTEAYNHGIGTQIGVQTTFDDVFDTYHIYALEWLPDMLIWYVDGEEVFRYSVPENAEINSATWPFDIEYHLLLNIAVGGSWGGAQGIDDSIFPQEMVIDYVRLYQDAGLSGE